MFLSLFIFAEFSYIDVPKSTLLLHGEYEIAINFEKNGRIQFGFDVGFFDILNTGIYYGGENIIGEESISWDRKVDPHIKIGFGGEDFLLNFSSGYTAKNGAFAEIGKCIELSILYLELDGGINYYERSIGLFAGAEILLSENIGIDLDLRLEKQKYHNLAIKWMLEEGVYLKFINKNLLTDKWERSIRVGFTTSF